MLGGGYRISGLWYGRLHCRADTAVWATVKQTRTTKDKYEYDIVLAKGCFGKWAIRERKLLVLVEENLRLI